MNSKKKELFIIIAICILIFIIKLSISFQTQHLNHESYFHLFQAKEIQNTGFPEVHELIFDASILPVQDYLLAGLGTIFTIETSAKILSSLMSALITFIVFLIIKQITKKRKDSNIAIISSLFSGFIVTLFAYTSNNYTSLNFSLLIFLITTYLFIKSINHTNYLNAFIISIILFILISPLSIIFIATYIIYFLFLTSERIKIRPSEIEMFIFSMIASIWLYSILYKDLILNQGVKYFLNPLIIDRSIEWNLINVVAMIGVIPVLFGSFGIYQILTKKVNRENSFILSLIFTSVLLLITGFANKIFCFSILAIGIIITSSISLKRIKEIFNNSKLEKSLNLIVSLVLIVFFLTSVVPAITNAIITTQDTPTENDVYILESIRLKSDNEDIIIAPLKEIYVVKFFAERETALTNKEQFNIQSEKIKDIEEFYYLNLKINAIRTLNFYNIKYVYVSEELKRKLSETDLAKFEDPCFKKIKTQEASIYESVCEIKDEDKINEDFFEMIN